MNNELMHYGVKGMKWGIRKKNYTTSDLKKYKGHVETASKIVDKQKEVSKKQASKAHRKKVENDLSKMSDQELRDIVNRMNMEERYKQVMNTRQVEVGKSRTEKILDNVGTALTIGSSALSLAIAIKELTK